MSFENYKKLASNESVVSNLKARLKGGTFYKSDEDSLVQLTEYCQWLAHHAIAEYCGKAPNEPFENKNILDFK